MSYLTFKTGAASAPGRVNSLRSAYSSWLLANHGHTYRATVDQQLKQASNKKLLKAASRPAGVAEPLTVGIVGGGFAGLFSGLILQSLGIECELFESSDRVGGRIHTWYSSDYDPAHEDTSGLYGEMGGMRLPQFSADMLPVQQLALAVNAVLERHGLDEQKVVWRKFYYDSPVQRMRFNNMKDPILKQDADLNTLNFDVDNGGDVPQVWMTPKTGKDGLYLPVNMVMGQVNADFMAAITASFPDGFAMLMQYDQYSMWDYLTTVFTLGDMGQYYDPAMGAKSDLLPWSIASYLETTSVGTGMFSVSFVEMVIANYDWGGSKNPYDAKDSNVYMLTVAQGMQRFPDACRRVLDMAAGVREEDGNSALVRVGLKKDANGRYTYAPDNLTPDAQPPGSVAPAAAPTSLARQAAPQEKQRVFLKHKVVELSHDPALFDGDGGMKVKVRKLQGPFDEHDQPLRKREQPGDEFIDKHYRYVITTLPNGAYLNGEFKTNLLNNISFDKAQAIRESQFMPSFKAFLTFKTQFWAELGKRQDKGLGAASTDHANRQIIYPSYGYDGKQGVLQVYCWAQDARKLGALDDEARVAECLKGIAHLYPEVDIAAQFAGYHDGKTTKTWFWDEKSGGGAFALFNPGQFKNIYPALLTPEFDGHLNFAGECCSVHHGWIVGALDSAYNAVYHVLQHAGRHDAIAQLHKTWGVDEAPDIEQDEVTANRMEYQYAYNLADRDPAWPAQGAVDSIYPSGHKVFEGSVPAFIRDFAKVPQSMKGTAKDRQVLRMLGDLWDDNVARRTAAQAAQPAPVAPQDDAVAMLEALYYGKNFQTIPAPAFWLKDDDEFARQQLAGFMPTLLAAVSEKDVRQLIESANILHPDLLGPLAQIRYVADYRRYLSACTTIPSGYYLPKPIVFYSVNGQGDLTPVAIQLEDNGELFTPGMPNAQNAWLLAKMLTNCAGQTLHDVGFHQLLTHQICAMVSIALFSEEVFNPDVNPGSSAAFQQHPVFKLLQPHLSKALEFQQTIYNSAFDPDALSFPQTRTTNGKPGVYNIGFVYDQIFSCGRIGNYQLQDRIYGDPAFRFLDLAIPKDARKRGVHETPFSYAYVHDATLWYDAIAAFASQFVDTVYADGDSAVAADSQLQRFFGKLIPAFNYRDGGTPAQRFPDEVLTTATLKEVLAMFIWQFSVQHTVINDGAYNQAAFVPNASTLMHAPPAADSSTWTAGDVLACLPDPGVIYPALGKMTFMDIQINASVTGQGPYAETILGRNTPAPAIDIVQDTYAFSEPALREAVFSFYQAANKVGAAIKLRQARDTARYLSLHPNAQAIPETVVFNLIEPGNVMNTIQT